MTVPSGIFRQYDIRGIVGETIDPSIAEAVGWAYGAELRDRLGGAVPKVVVGQDNRPSSPSLADGLVRGARSSGCRVVRLGTVPTPVAYFAEQELGAHGSLQVTGSHNPSEYNGIKMTVAKGSLHGDAIQGLLARIRSGGMGRRGQPAGSVLPGEPSAAGSAGEPAADSAGEPAADLAASAHGAVEQVDVLPAYVAAVAGRFRPVRPVKVVVDCGNGTGAVVAVELLEAAGAQVVPLYCESDGTFPNHHPDPTVDANVRELAVQVRRHGAEAGIGFDGDADRIGVVDGEGRIVRADMLLLLFGLEMLRRLGPGVQLVFDVKCSQALPEVFERAGGVPLMWKTGHSLVKEKMRETGAPIAGELSGHICFADDYYGFDDALYAACRLVEMIAGSERSLAELTSELPSYASTPEMRIEVSESEKFDLVADAREHFARDHEVIALDGARVLFGDGWGLIRASNTQPAITVRCEAATEARLGVIRETLARWLRDRGVRM